MNEDELAKIIGHLAGALEASIALSAKAQKYRATIGQAIAEGRDLSGGEMDLLRDGARAGIDRLG